MERYALGERILELRKSGISLGRIAAILNEEQIPTSRGGSQWRASSVQAVLRRRALEE